MNLLTYNTKSDWRYNRPDFKLRDSYIVNQHVNGVVLQRTVDVYAVNQTNGNKVLHHRSIIKIGTTFDVLVKHYGKFEYAIAELPKQLFLSLSKDAENISVIAEIEVGYNNMSADSPITVTLFKNRDVSSYFSSKDDIAEICDKLLGQKRVKENELAAFVESCQSFEKTFYGDIAAPVSQEVINN